MKCNPLLRGVLFLCLASFLFTGSSFALEIISPAFKDGENIPVKYTGEGKDVSPPLNWSGAPKGTINFAVIVYDPDAPRGGFAHWVVYGMPGTKSGLREAITPLTYEGWDYRQGVNSYGKIGYKGPYPPLGPKHKYIFTIYALSARVDIPAGASREILHRVMKKYTLAEAELVGYFGRK